MEGGVVKVVDVTIDLSPREIIPKYKMDSHPTGFLGEVIFLRLSVYFPNRDISTPCDVEGYFSRNYDYLSIFSDGYRTSRPSNAGG